MTDYTDETVAFKVIANYQQDVVCQKRTVCCNVRAVFNLTATKFTNNTYYMY